MIPENTVPTPEMVGMITTIVVKVNPEREDSETRTVSVLTALSWGTAWSTGPQIIRPGKNNRLSFCFFFLIKTFLCKPIETFQIFSMQL